MVQGDAAFRTNTNSNFLGSWQDSTDLSTRPRLPIDLNHIFTCSGLFARLRVQDCLLVQTSKHLRPETFLKLGGPLPFVYEGETA